MACCARYDAELEEEGWPPLSVEGEGIDVGAVRRAATMATQLQSAPRQHAEFQTMLQVLEAMVRQSCELL